jgi:hypothetical protein
MPDKVRHLGCLVKPSSVKKCKEINSRDDLPKDAAKNAGAEMPDAGLLMVNDASNSLSVVYALLVSLHTLLSKLFCTGTF